jgi:glucose dehydrogenase
MLFNNTILTKKTLKKTDNHFADIYQGCIDEVISGEVKVNDLKEYIKKNKINKIQILKGIGRNNFTYLQRAYWIQTGDMPALLP